MKKTKILAMSLSTISLVSLAIATPLIITSCNNDTSNKEEVTNEKYESVTLKETFVDFCGSFSIGADEDNTESPVEPFNNIYTNNQIVISPTQSADSYVLSLKNNVQEVLDEKDIQKYKIDINSKINWTLSGWSKYTKTPNIQNSTAFQVSNVNKTSNYKLIGSIGESFKFKVDVIIKLK